MGELWDREMKSTNMIRGLAAAALALGACAAFAQSTGRSFTYTAGDAVDQDYSTAGNVNLSFRTTVNVNAYLIDAIIGLSVVYKALDNLGAYQRWFGVQPDTRIATLVFGLFHGFGLAAKIQEFEIARDGLLPNLLAFNVGVEIGQLLALCVILIAMGYWRRTAGFLKHAYTANVALMCAGFLLIGYQLTGLFIS